MFLLIIKDFESIAPFRDDFDNGKVPSLCLNSVVSES